MQLAAYTFGTCKAESKGTHSRVDFVWHIELLAGVHDDWCDGWIMSVADARKKMVNHLRQNAKMNMLLMQGSPRHMKFAQSYKAN